MKYRALLVIWCLFFTAMCSAQNGKNVFCDSLVKSNTLMIKEKFYNSAITRQYCDTLINYYAMDIHDKISLTKATWDAVEQDFLPFKFSKRNDSLFMNYYEPIKKREVTQYQYPTNKRDTIAECRSYRLAIDSSLRKINDTLYSVYNHWTDNQPGDYYCFNETVYMGDTVISVLGHRVECYHILQIMLEGRDTNPMQRHIMIEKNCLVPVEEDEYVYIKHGWNLCRLPHNQWSLFRTFRITGVE